MDVIGIVEKIVMFLETSGILGVFIACTIMCIESIFPVIPLAVFITINMLVLGNLWGFILSWIFTIIGCIISYFIFKKGFGNRFERLTENKELLAKYKKLFKNISTGKLVLIIAMPFTPAFMVNIVSGLVKMDFKKYFIALLIGKLSMVYFWGFVGTSLIESIHNPLILVKIAIIMIVVYLLYLIIKKILKLD